MRRNNVHIIGLPERSEGNSMRDFLEKWFREVFGGEELSPLFAVERAHRIPLRAPPFGRVTKTCISETPLFQGQRSNITKGKKN